MELLTPDNHVPLTGAQQAELESRMASLDRDRLNGVTWTALKAEQVAVSDKRLTCWQSASGTDRRQERRV
jgi:hypothetical protein